MTDNGWTDMDDFDAELDRLLSGAGASADAPAWCGDVAVLVRRATAPARPDELAREADIVARMQEIRFAIIAGDEPALTLVGDEPTLTLVEGDHDGPDDQDHDDDHDGTGEDAEVGAAGPVIAAGEQAADAAPESPVTAEPVRPRNGRSFDVAVPRIAAITTEGEITPVADLPGSDAPAEAGVNGTRAHRVPDPLAQRLRARVAEQQEIAELDAYRAKHGGEASYQAKHAAERVDDDHHAVVRTVSRLVAVKAVAIATAAAIGVAAAAAATTGIVANVVVPAINESVGKPVTTVPTTAAHHPDSSGATTGSGAHRSTATGEATGSDCTTMSLLPTCVPLPPILVVTVPPDVAAEVTAATGSTPGTTTPDTTPSTTVPDTSTTSETTPETTPTTEVEPPPSTDPPPPETTVPPTDPGQSVNPFSGP